MNPKQLLYLIKGIDWIQLGSQACVMEPCGGMMWYSEGKQMLYGSRANSEITMVSRSVILLSAFNCCCRARQQLIIACIVDDIGEAGLSERVSGSGLYLDCPRTSDVFTPNNGLQS